MTVKASPKGFISNTYPNWLFSQDYAFPNITDAAAGTTGQIKYWNGSSWVAKPMKVWNGSAWVVKPVKYWNGASWTVTPY